MKYNKIFIIIFAVSVLLLPSLNSCKDSWLEPKPLSFYTPENTYVDVKGFEAALAACEKVMYDEYNGDGCAILTEMIQSDICVEGTTDKAGPQMDMDKSLLPDALLNHTNYTRVGWYWTNAYKAIKYANIIIARINDVTFSSDAEKNAILGQAYFHRAYWYYKLVHQFGNVPYLDWELTNPKTDFYTYDRWSILEHLKKDIEFANEWVKDNVDRGRVSKSACGTLLMKLCLCLGSYDQAIEIGKSIVSMHPLMTNRFTSNMTKAHTNLMHDLHSVEAKLNMSNTEGLMYIVAYPNMAGSIKSYLMRNTVPRLIGVTTPDGLTGVAYSKDVEPQYEINTLYGRGIGRARCTNYYQYTIWTDKEKGDMRGVYNRDSWKSPSDLYYNNPDLKKKGNKYYGTHLVKNPAMSVEDSIRSWYQWPHYKLLASDPIPEDDGWWGGEVPMYIYRSAEVYLLMGEAYYWKDQPAQAAEMLNVVRQRAGASPLTSSDVNIGAILDERARELYYEENRHSEITRIAFIYAKTGKTCEYFGRTYSLNNISGSGGAGSNIKQSGINFWYDWVTAKSNFYNKGVTHRWATYAISVHHILWPIPASAINANTNGVINQNIGYPGAENNLTPLIVPSEGTVIEK
ncbi:MAG: starch-binding protein [Bacteroidetes bacterium GWF2_42_66]|nr:MAG: starch-binding protein [Bacteroidetes bacterium GWE2_42_39]OFY43363.1 MAG: starch-binding protein [Bacteroidetes bacterium GWF2_42_66]HBL77452.1 RagB/SusD family nutrient uptake outer membrane protein [Prolixibacteraceae bacterium]HCU61765.1 RagB/SusD family nutrient uptake outer membrane protein [Prolixibacteraceae bacterium]